MTEAAEKNRGGRPPGTVGKRTLRLREVADEALRIGTTPLEVMLINMRHYHEEAERIKERILANGNTQVEALTLLKDLCNFRDKAQTCAVDAAPYVHSRLAAISVSGHVSGSVEHIHSAMTAKEAIEAYAHAINAEPAAFIEHKAEEEKE